jgi:hypothetical protein
MKRQIQRTILWTAVMLLTLLLNRWAAGHPETVENWYSNGLFQGVRLVADYTTGRLPIPAFYLFWAGVIGWWGWQIWRRPALTGWHTKLFFWIAKIAQFAACLIALFYWMWGFNYQRVPVARHLSLHPVPLDSAALWDELRLQTAVVDSLRRQLRGTDTTALHDKSLWPPNTEDTIRAAVENWLTANRYTAKGRVRGRLLYPGGVLRVFGTAGIYWPFAAEGNVDGGLHPLEQLPGMAHEMAHGFGFGDEGICNYIAYAACHQHPNLYIAYAGHLSYWRIVAGNCLESDPARYDSLFRPFMPRAIRADLNSIYAQSRKFREWMPRLRYRVYDHYLKAQGIQAGMLNYDEVMMLVRAGRE